MSPTRFRSTGILLGLITAAATSILAFMAWSNLRTQKAKAELTHSVQVCAVAEQLLEDSIHQTAVDQVSEMDRELALADSYNELVRGLPGADLRIAHLSLLKREEIKLKLALKSGTAAMQKAIAGGSACKETALSACTLNYGSRCTEP